jgi:hypothetical protein
MRKSSVLFTALTVVVLLGSACGRFASKEALLDGAANLVIAKYQNSSCAEIAQMKSQSNKSSPASGGAEAVIQEKAIELLRNDPELRTEFINRVAGPIANKMFECNLIP